ncbi:glutathione ABC transporter substrate-binding protein [Salinibacillus xinjiangensis]|uniref:Glutathione ABC transporter substrate-binding protein n=1 Tax=Salinibacillus xinjiangensis TaxID=1229268 RepID=A0A6G1XAD3_9BACI|nr:glutathione ABC transporter substrate-binding protein [Salinibacillus xinjiangensis]MRG87889.1 glutathione ABC transporter substrate-binding protein [Salinibacillus xinjiangensis]
MKKIAMLMAISFLAILMMTGCTSEPQTGGSSDSEGAEGSGNGSAAGDELIIAVLSDATQLDPHTGTDIPSANVYHGKIYEGLVKQDENMEIQPALATEWEPIDDVTWEFTLREGVKFHDGTPFNAEAVKKNFERILSEEIASPRATLFEMIEEVKVVDDYTVQIKTAYPFAPLLANLAHYAGGIVSPTAAEKYGKELGQHPVGTGKFKFEEWTPGSQITLSTYDEYWGETPSYETVVYKVVPEDATRIAMVETGEAHLAEPVPVTEIERIENSDSMSLNRSQGLGTDYLGFNVQKEPFNNKKVRQAINYAVDTEQIIEGVYNNVGTVADSPMGPGVWGYNENVEGYEYNIEKAKELLKEAGYEDGFKTSIWTNDNQARVDVAEVVQSQLKGIGIEAEINVMEWGAYLEATANGEHDMFILGWSNMTGDADYNQYFLFHSEAQGTPGNRTFYENEKVDELIDAGRQETDPEKRLEIYAEAQKIEVEDAPAIFLRYDENLVAVNNNVEGFWMHPAGIYMIDDITINE